MEFPYIYKNNNETLSFIDYFNQKVITGNFPGNYEMVKLSQIYLCNILIYNNFNFTEKNEKFIFDYETMISDNDNSIHFILIF